LQIVFDWILNNYIELIGSALGIAYVLLASKQNIWCWILGIISCALYIIVFFTARLYGDMSLQFLYLLMGIYGWVLWHKKAYSTQQNKVKSISLNIFIALFIVIVLLTISFGFMLSFTDNPIPYIDGFTTALGITATWMTAKKYIENWLLWIFANTFCVGVYYYRLLHPTAIFYFIMAILAYRGYLIWKKELSNN